LSHSDAECHRSEFGWPGMFEVDADEVLADAASQLANV